MQQTPALIRKHPSINCPDCQVRMKPFACGHAVVDRCLNCGGLWFDEREIGIFRNHLNEIPLGKIQVESVAETLAISTCPRCQLMLDEGNYGYKSEVRIKRCSGCSGIWLPEAQMLKFVDLVRVAQMDRPIVSQIVKDLHQESEGIQKFNQIVSDLTIDVGSARSFRFFPVILPLWDVNPRNILPIITLTLIAINFFIQLMVGPSMQLILETNGLIASEFWNNPLTSDLLSYFFLHSGWWHLLSNLFVLWMFGDNVEEKMGPLSFLIFYILCGILAGAGFCLIYPSTTLPLVGASGAIAGVAGAYLALFPGIRIKTLISVHIVEIPAWILLWFWLGSQLLWTLIKAPYSKIAFASHVIGFLVGYIFARLSKISGA